MTKNLGAMASTAWPDVADAIRKTMASNKGTNTRPELLLRSSLHSAGYRFRIHGRALPGKPDIVFAGRRKVVWVHGCFWHAHPGCRFSTTPKTRAEYWIPKLIRNRERDAEHARRLAHLGWESAFLGPPRQHQTTPFDTASPTKCRAHQF
jgi:DNA mismatch endonuclease (patch repair protein)